MKYVIAFLFFILPCTVSAQIYPVPSANNSRIQTVRWAPSQAIILTALPETGITVVLESGEQIRRITLEDQNILNIRISPERDSFLAIPLSNRANTGVLVESDRRDYRFTIQVGEGVGTPAAYLVAFDFTAEQPPNGTSARISEPAGKIWAYRVRGDKAVRPETIQDDGIRTRITFAPSQALPAIFAVGPSGKEEVINGYMREGVFVIDRTYEELVFRIDKKKATARRNNAPEENRG